MTDSVTPIRQPVPQRANVSFFSRRGTPNSSRSATPQRRKEPHRYRGHRADSFVAEDINELVEIRARQRTFNGAYARTALANLAYALTVLKLFDRRFYRIGLLYLVLSVSLFIFSFIRARHSRHDFADNHRPGSPGGWEQDQMYANAIKTVGQTGKRIFGRPFITAGWIVLALTFVVATVEIALLILLLKLKRN